MDAGQDFLYTLCIGQFNKRGQKIHLGSLSDVAKEKEGQGFVGMISVDFGSGCECFNRRKSSYTNTNQ
jgi:hypothetical protein